jgi:hypothetical protein
MNPWDAVAQLRWQYEQAISANLKATEAYVVHKSCPVKKEAQQAALKTKTNAYWAYMRAFKAALNSGVPRPND